MNIRKIDPNNTNEIQLVATRMKQTLIDVMGEKKGDGLYSMDWLLDRVDFHLSLGDNACIFLSENDTEISGQAIVRIEEDDQGTYGYFSTIYVDLAFRKKGIAKALIERVIDWCQEKGLSRITYNTAKDHPAIIPLFQQFGFKIVLEEDGMVKLLKSF